MIVTCPACTRRYVVDPAALRATGRTVRCARCAHTWHQDPPKGWTPSPPPPPAVFQPPPRRQEDAGAEGMSPLRYHAQLPAIREPEPRWGLPVKIWAGLAVVVVLAGAALVVFREQIVAMWPASERVYAAVGLPVASPWDGLELGKTNSDRTTIEDKTVYVITGDITNVSAVTKAVPKLQLTVTDKAANKIVSVVPITPDLATLSPGAKTGYTARLVDPPEKVDLSISWARE